MYIIKTNDNLDGNVNYEFYAITVRRVTYDELDIPHEITEDFFDCEESGAVKFSTRIEAEMMLHEIQKRTKMKCYLEEI